jgi:TPR repeat protein
MYYFGHGVARDHALARAWYAKAAARGDAFAQANLGALLAKGEGGTTDKVSALMWFLLAAAQAEPSGIAGRAALAAELSAAQIAEAEARAAALGVAKR